MAYRKAIKALIAKMTASVEWFITAAYRKNQPRVSRLASDSTPFQKTQSSMRDLQSRWYKVFKDEGAAIAKLYVTRLYKASNSAFRKALKDSGWSVDFQMTPAMNDAFQASLADNVGLIESIPEQYFGKVEGIVSRGYTAGRDLQAITSELKELHPVADRRAVLIARDQCNKANAVVQRTRQLELGIEEAIWMHSHGGKEPRPSHVAANGRKFKVDEGCLIDGEYILPGQLINCRCTSRAVLPI